MDNNRDIIEKSTDVIHNSTGLWPALDYGSTPSFNSGVSGKIIISRKDKDILRKLASKVAELAYRPLEEEKRKLWLSNNSLKPIRPLVFCDPENGWNEIITKDQIEFERELAQRWEMVLRKEIFWGESMQDDKVIEPYFDIGYTYTESSWGFNAIIHSGNGGGSYVWESPIKRYSDIDKLHFPIINVDYKATQKTLEVASDTFGDLIKVRKTGIPWQSLGLTFTLALLRGLTNIMIDMLDNPKLIHRIMKILSEGTLKKLDFLGKNGLLSLNTGRYIGSGGFGYTEELPAKDFNNSQVRAIDMWGFCESQETGRISPQMFEEFVFPYQLPILERFGLNYYGCCEPLDLRWHIIKNIPNLRRVSVSPWANVGKMAEYLQDKYVYCKKMIPTDLAVPKIDKDVVRKRIRDVLNIAKGCVIELIMKDNHTIGKNPNNVIRWTQIAREEAEKIS